jgi:hypothetical protein
MADPIRITAEEVRQRVTTGSSLLVCAYDDEGKFARFHLEGAISLADFESRLPSLEKSQEIFFYCA